jgi:multiple sugar transport system permease protein
VTDTTSTGPGTTGPGTTGVLEAPPRARPRRRRARPPLSEGARAERRLGWLLCAPAVVVMLAVTAYPIGYAIYLSLQRYDLRFPAQSQFIGLANYATVLSDSLWWTAFGVTALITVVSVAVELVLGMGLALIMRWALLGRGAVRTAILIPYGIVTVVAAYSWQYAWTPDTGYLANLLPTASAPLTQQWPAIGIIILAEIWKTTPFMALLLLAGVSLVPDELLRAAKVDGATAWQRFTLVMLPLMKPAILVAVLFRTLDAFRIFDNIFIMTAGANNTRSVSILGYDNLFTALNLGIGSTISVLIFVAVAIIAFIFVRGFGTAAPGQEVADR